LACRYKAAPSGWIEETSYKKHLADFYGKHNPAKIAEIDQMLETYSLRDIVSGLRKQ
jgi:hypothetical protein